jgi:hypothetical protein
MARMVSRGWRSGSGVGGRLLFGQRRETSRGFHVSLYEQRLGRGIVEPPPGSGSRSLSHGYPGAVRLLFQIEHDPSPPDGPAASGKHELTVGY